MFTKVFSKCNRFQKLCIFLIVVLLAALHATSIAWVRSTTPVTQDKLLQGVIEKRIRCAHNISRKPLCQKVEQNDTEPEQSFESFVIDEVTRVCTDIYPDLDPTYILAIIYHESRFQPDAVNHTTNATGLMQILPKWHTTRAENLGVSLTDPAGNILVGCDILNEVYQRYGSFSYAVNVYAGGYVYANNYKNTKSPYEKALDSILASGVLNSIGR